MKSDNWEIPVKWLGPGLIGVCCAVVAVFMWRADSGLKPDSVTYLDMAQSIFEGKGAVHRWAYWDPVYDTCRLPTSTSMWPPGYPLAIAGAAVLGFDPYIASRLIPLVCFVLLPFPLYGLARQEVGPARGVICAFCATLVFPVAWLSAASVTEVPFLLAASVSALLTAKSLKTSGSKAALLIALASSAAACSFLLRYAGLACCAAVGMYGLVSAARCKGTARCKLVAAAVIPAGIVVFIVLARNFSMYGSLGRPWSGANVFWISTAQAAVSTVRSIFGSRSLFGPGVWFFVLVQVVCVCVLLVVAVVNVRNLVRARRTRTVLLSNSFVVVAVFATIIVLTVLSANAGSGTRPEGRYFAIITPWYFIVASGLALLSPRHQPTGVSTARLRVVFMACGALWFCQAMAIVQHLRSAQEGYVSASKSSPAIRWIRANVAPEQVVLSTRGAAIAFWCPNPVLRLPRAPHSRVSVTDWEDVDRIGMRAGATYLVHFRGTAQEDKYAQPEVFAFLRALDEPAQFPERVLAVWADAVVYRLKSHRQAETFAGSLSGALP